MNVNVIKEKAAWREALTLVGGYDFAHTFDFHQISMANGEGEPIAFVATQDDGRPLVVWPVLKRRIPGTDYFDFNSVYGYSGPVVGAGVDSELAIKTLLQSMREYGAVSLFSRMHPLLLDRLAEKDRGDRLGEIVIIDVGTSEDVLSGYRGSHRREITKALAAGVSVSVEDGPDAVANFHDIYCRAMTNIGARNYYFFNHDYLNALKATSDFRTFIMFANLEGRRIAASMFVVTGPFMQYYLSGTDSEFRRIAASKLIIAEAHKLAVRLNLRYLLLGGGVGSGQDALFSFKKGFSSFSLPFYLTRRILDSDRYFALCKSEDITPEEGTFFPAYRRATVAEG